MKKYRLFLVILVIMTLLVAATVPASAGKGNTGKPDKPKPGKPPAGVRVPPGQQKKAPQAPPAEGTPEPGEGGMVTICHKPGTPAEQTLVLPAPAIPGHLRHGDALGPCDLTPTPPISPTATLTLTVTPTPTITPTATITPTETPTTTARFLICHKPGTPAEKTLSLPAPPIPGHLRHGDTLGPCSLVPPLPTPTPTGTLTVTITPTPTPTFTWKVSICHKPDSPAEKTLVLPLPSIPGHLRHGDTLGSCLEATPTPTATLTPTATVTPTATETPTVTVTPTETETPPSPRVSALNSATNMRVVICHKPDSPAQKTMALPADAMPDHLGHGDTLGPCPEPPAETWAMRLAAAFRRWFGPLLY